MDYHAAPLVEEGSRMYIIEGEPLEGQTCKYYLVVFTYVCFNVMVFLDDATVHE